MVELDIQQNHICNGSAWLSSLACLFSALCLYVDKVDSDTKHGSSVGRAGAVDHKIHGSNPA